MQVGKGFLMFVCFRVFGFGFSFIIFFSLDPKKEGKKE